MKRTGESAWAFVRNPDPGQASALVYGADPVLVRHCRRLLAGGLPGNDEFGPASIDAARAAANPGLVRVEITRRDFFGDRRVALLEDVTDRHAKGIEAALANAAPEDAFLLVTAGDLRPASTLRKLYEGARNAVALPVEAPKWQASDLRRHFTDAGLPPPRAEASALLADLSRELDWSSFRMLLEKLELYQHGRAEELAVADVDACTSRSGRGDSDELVDAVMRGRLAEAARHWRHQTGLGASPTSLLGAVLRHLAQVRTVLARARGAREVDFVARSRRLHPLRRAAVARDARQWREERLEQAINHLVEADLGLRGESATPPATLGEHALMKVAARAPRARAEPSGGGATAGR